MLGDIIEASSRTLTHPTPARIRSLVRERIGRVYSDGQLDDCELTLKNLSTIADTFTRIFDGNLSSPRRLSGNIRKRI